MEDLLNQAQEQLKTQDFVSAIATLTAYLTQDPYCAEAYYQRGVANYRAQKIHAAVSDYGKALDCDPEHAKAYYARALARLTLENPTGAMTDINSAIQGNRNNPAAYQFRGRLYRKQGDRAAAITNFKTAARLFAEQGKPDRARDCIASIEDLQAQPNPQKFTGALAPTSRFFEHIQVLIELNESAKATRLLTERLGSYPNEGVAYYYRGCIKLTEGALESAIADINQGIGLGYQESIAYRSRAEAKLRLGDIQGAIADCNQALSIDDQADIFTLRGNAYRAMKHYLGAIEEYAEALSRAADDGGTYYERAITYEAMGEFPQAIADFQRAMSLFCDQEQWDLYKQAKKRLEDVQNAQAIGTLSPIEGGPRTSVASHYDELLRLLGNNQELADGMIKRMQTYYPSMSRDWCIESVLNNVKRDMEL